MKIIKRIMIPIAILFLGTGLWGLCEIRTSATFSEQELPFHTGTMDYIWKDRSRVDPATGKPRTLIVRTWYPADKRGAGADYHPNPDVFTSHISEQFGIPKFIIRRLAKSQTNAVWGSPLTDRSATFPVLLFSHGLNGSRVQNSKQMEYLAGNGYVLFSIEHTGASSGTVLPGDAMTGYLEINGMPEDLFSDSLVNVWSDDHLFVVEMLDSLQSSGEVSGGEPLFSRLELDKMGLFGHSFGGNATARSLSRSDRFATGINMDGYYLGYGYKNPFIQPFLEIRSPWPDVDFWDDRELERMNTSREVIAAIPENWDQRLKEYAPHGAKRVVIPETNHMTFSDFLNMMPFQFITAPGYRKQYRYSSDLVKIWFDHHLRGLDMPKEFDPELVEISG